MTTTPRYDDVKGDVHPSMARWTARFRCFKNSQHDLSENTGHNLKICSNIFRELEVQMLDVK
jgi:hypothetical protein